MSTASPTPSTTTSRPPPFEEAIGTRLYGLAPPVLPASYHDSTHATIRVQKSIETYLNYELNPSRLTAIHRYLGVAGRQMNARALHRQRMYNRAIIATEDINMHLVWFESTIFIKPLPEFLLSHDFWKTHLCTDDLLHASALGYLLSYSWLVCHPSDFFIAKELHLLPLDILYENWTRFMDAVISTVEKSTIDRRYRYGELRLTRLNWIYRLAPQLRFKYFVRGYYVLHHQYASFFRRHFSWITITLFAYFALVLTAMQVGLATDGLKDNLTFNAVSEWCAVICMALPLLVFVIVVVLFLFYALYNLVATIQHLSKRRRSRKGTHKKGEQCA
ncbi:hypothetical protein K504DRAFT_376633 [Pleomassaria siparia CBS 279.74]|uniref:Subtilisin-like serine protease n=1 Tax=Pleomassaria siparia CBS 279.74 TaxID=1314801 RepID=A0A6G1KFG9_9PLEO|nr:hypothetical protein K504DRAFT_376633 [Pleomassaria siparia CBS 279.74]